MQECCSMTDRPIIFSAPMVRALLAGTKTQTRRLATSPLRRVEAGDRLYVREHWRGRARMDAYAPREFTMDRSRIAYLADGKPVDCPLGEWKWGKHRQGMHMPRWASRLTLVVVDTVIEPLETISERDALAEGLERKDDWLPMYRGSDALPWRAEFPVDAYRDLWDSLHPGEGQRWQDNPDVVALTFRVERGNIDTLNLENARG
jgi:hypothetical protein